MDKNKNRTLELLMLTKFGMAIRKIRIDRNMKLGDMAKGMQVTSAYLSAVENGKKKLTNELVEKVSNFLELSEEDRTEINEAAALSQQEFNISIKDEDSDVLRTTVGALARRIESSNLNDEDAKAILKILKG
ncbi:transcriptional regulator [Pseudoalteromonas rubra]|uniref:Transcriptional regulator n=1 Tax=Pseudoalteromonas rubra TaxID=43658 RepID=A0A4Q7E0F9_9GAMM|nr:helix-turn-helix transcriptional regulator [Pseudoalteromonas rubra]RZM74073.1 transcriptional regulator [Pseudoalteromonas rubra]